MAAPGATVTLDGSGSTGGPWGTNITYAWTALDGLGNAVTGLTLTGADTARPSFTMPDPAPASGLVFTLTVTGKGGDYARSDTVTVTADATAPALTDLKVDGGLVTLTYGEDLKVGNPAPSGRQPVYLVTLDKRRMANLPQDVTVSGNTVTMTVDPPAEFGQTVRLSYYPDETTEETRVQDPAGNKARGFTGRTLRNVTKEGPGIIGLEIRGADKTYRTGDTIRVEATFDETVTVDVSGGRPTIGLTVGTETRTAEYGGITKTDTTFVFAYRCWRATSTLTASRWRRTAWPSTMRPSWRRRTGARARSGPMSGARTMRGTGWMPWRRNWSRRRAR